MKTQLRYDPAWPHREPLNAKAQAKLARADAKYGELLGVLGGGRVILRTLSEMMRFTGVPEHDGHIRMNLWRDRWEKVPMTADEALALEAKGHRARRVWLGIFKWREMEREKARRPPETAHERVVEAVAELLEAVGNEAR